MCITADDRAAVRALVDALERCNCGALALVYVRGRYDTYEQCKPCATKRVADKSGYGYTSAGDIGYAPALRALLRRMKTWPD